MANNITSTKKLNIGHGVIGTMPTGGRPTHHDFNLLINRRSHMFMIQLLTSNIIDEHFDYHYRNVPRVFKKQVKEQLIVNGAGHLADDNVTNYIGPRPKLADDPLFSNLKKDEETDIG